MFFSSFYLIFNNLAAVILYLWILSESILTFLLSIIFAISLTAFNTVSVGPNPSATDLITYQSYVTYKKDADFALRIGRAWKYGELGAAYNFGYINSELSLGVHNPPYALKVLQSSIDWINAHP